MIPPAAEQITKALRNAPSLRGLYLSGSHGNGLADAYSDLDFIIVSDEGATDALAALWRQAVATVGEVILWRDRTVAPVLINAITAPDTRVDVLMLTPAQLQGHAQDSLRPLLDPDGLYFGLPAQKAHNRPDPRRMAYQFEEFIRILGLLPVAMGRGEYINGVTGIFHLRNLLIDLLTAETNAPHRGGALHMNRLLTVEQQDLLNSLPQPLATPESLLEAYRAYAAAYLHRARAYANLHDIPWPDQFEDVTLTQIGQSLNIQILRAP